MIKPSEQNRKDFSPQTPESSNLGSNKEQAETRVNSREGLSRQVIDKHLEAIARGEVSAVPAELSSLAGRPGETETIHQDISTEVLEGALNGSINLTDDPRATMEALIEKKKRQASMN